MIAAREFVKEAEKWEKEICSNCSCYNPRASALIFPPLGQRILFISESPYNYPRTGAKRLEDFIEVDLYCGLARSSCLKSLSWPRNIFEFIYQTFKPLFTGTIRKEWVEMFLKNVYWTHAAKKTLKNLNGRENREKKEKIAEICFTRSFPRELSKIKPVLIVCASSIALKLLLKRKYRDSLKTLLEIVGKEDRLPIVEDLIGESEPTISELKYLRKCKVAIFPNPSPVAGKWKKEYYQVERNRTKKVLEKVHFIVETNLLP